MARLWYILHLLSINIKNKEQHFNMTRKTFDDPAKVYDFEKCEACGTCLSKCHYLKYSPERAKEEIRRLREGEPSAVLNKCIGCWSCDLYCPNDCRPYSLIRSRWQARYEKYGLPEKARYLMPHEFPNFRSVVRYTPEETAFIEKIKNPPDSDTVLYTGCNTLVIADALRSKIFDGLPAFGSLDYCCGEMYYRMGVFDTARQAAEKLKKVFSGLKGRKVVFVCAACMDMVTNIYPNEFGIDLGVEGQFITNWLEEQIDSGKLKVTNPLNKKVTIQDSCHAKMLGREMYDSPRRLLAKLGAEVVEMEATQTESHCCGIAGGCARYSIVDLAKAGLGRLAETRGPRPDMTAAYCHGCLISLAIMRQFERWTPPLYPLIQLVQLATGENPQLGLTHSRAKRVMFGIARHAGPKMVSPKRFFLKPIE
jgi:Fe-S oxidoreductase